MNSVSLINRNPRTTPGTHLKSGSNVLIKTEPNPTLHRLAPTPPEPPRIIGSKYICGESVYKAVVPCKDKNPRFKWRLVGEGTDISSSGEIFITPTDLPGGQYTLFCTYISDKGRATTSKVLIVGHKNTCGVIKQITNVIQPQAESESIVYPNPTTGKVVIKFDNTNEEKVISVKDITGREVIKPKKIVDSKLMLDLSHLSSGIYFIEIKNSYNTEIYKIVKL